MTALLGTKHPKLGILTRGFTPPPGWLEPHYTYSITLSSQSVITTHYTHPDRARVARVLHYCKYCSALKSKVEEKPDLLR